MHFVIFTYNGEFHIRARNDSGTENLILNSVQIKIANEKKLSMYVPLSTKILDIPFIYNRREIIL
jgi:hypothetical protein